MSPARRGLRDAPATTRGSMLRYLDTTPMSDQLERAIHALRQAEVDRPGAGSADQPAARRDSREGAARRVARTSTPTCAATRASR